MSVIYGFKFKRIVYTCTCVCVFFAAVLQVSLNAEENDNQPRLRKEGKSRPAWSLAGQVLQCFYASK